MKKLLLIFALLIVGCQPSPQVIQTAIAKTEAAKPTIAPIPTITPIPPTKTPEATQTQNIGKWQTQTSINPLDDTQTILLSVSANSPIQGWLESATPLLVIRCKQQDIQMFINVGMQQEVESGLYDQSTVELRIDSEAASTILASHSTDGKGLFLPNPADLINQMLDHKTLIFGFTPFNSNPVVTTFDITGLRVAITPVLKACNK